NETISNKLFTELGNDVLAAAETLGFVPTSHELLSMMALLFFNSQNVDVILVEVDQYGFANTFAICSPKINAITRINSEDVEFDEATIRPVINALISNVKSGTHVVSADQSKLNL